jgi:hypothetical protein
MVLLGKRKHYHGKKRNADAKNKQPLYYFVHD